MSIDLPDGLIVTKEAVPSQIRGFERVEVEDVRALHRAYSANKKALPSTVGQRLENFFWRLWSSPTLLEQITGDVVAAQFHHINEGGDIRTTPRSSPQAQRSVQDSAPSSIPIASQPVASDGLSTTIIESSGVSSPSSGSSSSESQGLQIPLIPGTVEAGKPPTSPRSPTTPPASSDAPLRRVPPHRHPSTGQFLQPILKKTTSAGSRTSGVAFTIGDDETSDEASKDETGRPSQAPSTARPQRPGLAPRRPSARFEDEVTIIPTASSPQPVVEALQGEKDAYVPTSPAESSATPRRRPVFVAGASSAGGAGTRRRPVIRRRTSSTKTVPKVSSGKPRMRELQQHPDSVPALEGSEVPMAVLAKGMAAEEGPMQRGSSLPADTRMSVEHDSREHGSIAMRALAQSSKNRSFTNLAGLGGTFIKSTAVTGATASNAAGLLDLGDTPDDVDVNDLDSASSGQHLPAPRSDSFTSQTSPVKPRFTPQAPFAGALSASSAYAAGNLPTQRFGSLPAQNAGEISSYSSSHSFGGMAQTSLRSATNPPSATNIPASSSPTLSALSTTPTSTSNSLLPRTKSHLTMLLAKSDRASAGSIAGIKYT